MLLVEVVGAHKAWALKSRLAFPLSAVREVVARPETTIGWWHGMRLPGTHLPGVIVAGTYRNGQWHFWDVSKAINTLEIVLDGERYNKLFVEVRDPDETLQRLQAALAAQ